MMPKQDCLKELFECIFFYHKSKFSLEGDLKQYNINSVQKSAYMHEIFSRVLLYIGIYSAGGWGSCALRPATSRDENEQVQGPVLFNFSN